jgi:hypothetical protein
MKLKRSSMDAAEAEQQEAAPQQQQGGGAYISARLRNPGEVGASKKSSSGDMAGMVCAIIAVLILCAITAMLYMNWDLIKTA